jgi:hypothetical protein
VGAYLPLATTLPIFAGGLVKGLVDWKSKKDQVEAEDAELGKGSLFATGLVAGGALAGVLVAILSVNENIANQLKLVNMEHAITGAIGESGYMLLGTAFFLGLAFILYRIATKKD